MQTKGQLHLQSRALETTKHEIQGTRLLRARTEVAGHKPANEPGSRLPEASILMAAG